MIKIDITTKDNRLKEIKAKGHAFFDEKGKDIVCAAISALLQNIYIGLCSNKSIELKYIVDYGNFHLKLLNLEVLKKEEVEKIDFLVNTTMSSIKSISSSYGVKIKIYNKEVLK